MNPGAVARGKSTLSTHSCGCQITSTSWHKMLGLSLDGFIVGRLLDMQVAMIKEKAEQDKCKIIESMDAIVAADNLKFEVGLWPGLVPGS